MGDLKQNQIFTFRRKYMLREPKVVTKNISVCRCADPNSLKNDVRICTNPVF